MQVLLWSALMAEPIISRCLGAATYSKSEDQVTRIMHKESLL
jgi:hypothetical protein